MNLDQNFTVRDFCEREVVDWYKSIKSFAEFYQDCRIASLELLSIDISAGFNRVEIERIQQDVPKNISDAFDRHFWYSQYSLSELYLLKIPITEKSAFILLICGFLDDGWDNGGCWLEIFDEQGKFLSSGSFDCEGIIWKDRPLNGKDFDSPAPAWIGDEPELQAPIPMWSEEILTQYAVSIEHEGTKIRYVMPWFD